MIKKRGIIVAIAFACLFAVSGLAMADNTGNGGGCDSGGCTVRICSNGANCVWYRCNNGQPCHAITPVSA